MVYTDKLLSAKQVMESMYSILPFIEKREHIDVFHIISMEGYIYVQIRLEGKTKY